MGGELFFADADSNYSDADFVIFGAPFDGTSSFRKGSRFAPDAIREASYNFETYNPYFDIDLADIPFHDAGDADIPFHGAEDVDIPGNYTVEQAQAAVGEMVTPILRDGKIPIMLGGEHSLTVPCVRGSMNHFNDLGVVVLDAHFDLRQEYEGQVNSHACVSRRIIEDITDNYTSIGIRSGTRDEYSLARSRGITYYPADFVEDKGIPHVLAELSRHLDLDTSHLYLSLDMDVLDPVYAPALGTPEPFGLTDRQVLSLIRRLAPRSIGFDLVEIAPGFDSGNTALLGAKFVREFIASARASR
ncbi:MAG: N(1)-aminopropylagmatine ureohydrolase [ANME-2 cluster archaeon]|nr:N(1)-aminopropylagmatine ureohydrolase [ANME-2 cluster archaeon]